MVFLCVFVAITLLDVPTTNPSVLFGIQAARWRSQSTVIMTEESVDRLVGHCRSDHEQARERSHCALEGVATTRA